ncbi:MAG: uroporphyrinogen-III C-methyltransferase [Proteobacteria bacterium]|nr:uroporphyrinogen-III C-methyltransferase [Pseudomonadota bacterium]
MAKGTIFLIGAGPGDPALITIKGVEAIKAADCVIYDFLASSRLLDYASTKAERIYVGKKGATNVITQKEITALMIRKAKSGKTVARLKGGDPFIFGRGAEEAEAIVDAGLCFEVIPGVTSAIAAPAFAGIPLTHREFSSAVTFITGQEDPIKERTNIAWDRLSTGRGTLVFLMGWKNLPLIQKKLLANGWDPATPVALVRWGTMTRQQSATGTLGDVVQLSKDAGMLPPMVIVVGEVVTLRTKLDWFESRPLFAKRVLVTRTAEQAGSFTAVLENRGAEPVNFPTIKTVAPPSWKEFDRSVKRLSTYDWAIFTSANGVKYFIERLHKLGLDIRELKGVKLCAIGPQTAAAVKALGIGVDLVPKKFIAEGVLEAFGKRGIKGKKFLLPRALKAREILPIEISRLGGKIDVVPVYKTIRPRSGAKEVRERFLAGEIDAVTFTSSSTVTNFAAMFKKGEAAELVKDSLIACIGPVTAATAKELGFTVGVMAKEYTIPGLTTAMEKYYKK